MKKTRLRRKSKSPQRKLEDLLWVECKRIVDKMYGTNCYTCPAKNLIGANKQLGHVPWAKATLGANLKYDIRVLRNQCFRCNIHLGGQGAEAYKRMLREEGKAYMDKLEKERHETVKASEHYSQLLEYYQSL